MSQVSTIRESFSRLHDEGTFLIPNAWDVGSARLFESLGAVALATTSSGLAAGLGRHDQTVTRDELVAHVQALTSSVDIPVSVDAEDGLGDLADLSETARLLADAGAAGVSIEDYRPGAGMLPIGEAVERVTRFAAVAHEHGMTVTVRAENHLYGVGDLDDTVRRLQAYVAAGGDVAYAPGLVTVADLSRIVSEVDRPVNALILPVGPDMAELREIGVRRVSTGGALAFAAYGAAARAFQELDGEGTMGFTGGSLTWDRREAAFGDRTGR